MQNALKQSGARVTGLLSGQFHSARVRLTIVYVAILVSILFLFSSIIYSLFSTRIQNRFDSVPGGYRHFTLPNGELPPSPVDLKGDLIYTLFVVNSMVLVMAGVFSYWLAGITLEPIQESFDQQRQFLGDASHELRTPLAILQTDLENELHQKNISAAAKERAESHLEEVERMSKLVSDLLLLSRLDADVAMKKTEEVNLARVVHTAIDRLQGYAHKNNITLTEHAHDHAAVHIAANNEHVLQAVSNLVKNAIDYNKPDGLVDVSLMVNQQVAIIRVADTGVGIPETELQSIFQRFHRVDKSRSRLVGGSGLGLSIVLSIAHTYGGTVSLKSKEGEGTTATLSFPLLS